MACIFMDGFEIASPDDTAGIWTSVLSGAGGVIEYDAINQRSFLGSLKITNTDALISRWVSQTLPTTYSQLYGGFGLYLDSSQPIVEKYYNTLPLFTVQNSNGNVQLTLGINTNTMQIVVFRGEVNASGVKIATGNTVLNLDTWYYIQWRYIIHNKSGLVQIRINGIVDINKSPIDTKTSGTANIAAVTLGILGGEAIVNFDDFIINDTTGSYANSWPGNASVQFIIPDGDGFYSDWLSTAATRWTEIDDYSAHGIDDGDTTAIGSNIVGGHVSVTMEDIASTGDINAIMLVAYQRSEIIVTAQQLVRLSGVDSYTPLFNANVSDYAFQLDILTENPFTTLQWSEADINALELGWVAY